MKQKLLGTNEKQLMTNWNECITELRIEKQLDISLLWKYRKHTEDIFPDLGECLNKDIFWVKWTEGD